MSPTTNLPAAILDMVLAHLALLYLAATGGDLAAARHAAGQMLAAYHPETPDELHLAAEIISFSAHALEALGQASGPDLPLTKILRLRGGAVSLSRESHKSHRKLDQLQTVRRAGTPMPQAEAAPIRPRIENALALIEATRQATPAPTQIWTQGYQKRLAAKRITENLKKNQAAVINAAKADAQAAALAG